MVLFTYLNTLQNYSPPSESFIVNIGQGINTSDALYNELNEKLNFPYFGFNWDGLRDCLRDLSWLENKTIVLIHEDVTLLESREKRTYLKILNDTLQERDETDSKLIVVFPEYCKNEIDSLRIDFVRNDNPDPIRFKERFNLIPRELIDAAIDVSESRVSDVGWRASDALRVVNFLKQSNILILGGSIFSLTPGEKIKYLFKGWKYPFADPIESAIESKKVIENWVKENGEHFIFCIAFEQY